MKRGRSQARPAQLRQALNLRMQATWWPAGSPGPAVVSIKMRADRLGGKTMLSDEMFCGCRAGLSLAGQESHHFVLAVVEQPG